MKEDFDKLVQETKNIADFLVPYTEDLKVNRIDAFKFLRNTQFNIDGYEIDSLFYKCKYPNFYIDTLYISGGNYYTFLPFHVVIKLTKKFLGAEKLALREIFKYGKKFYIWQKIYDFDGNVIDATEFKKDYSKLKFEDFEYNYPTD